MGKLVDEVKSLTDNCAENKLDKGAIVELEKVSIEFEKLVKEGFATPRGYMLSSIGDSHSSIVYINAPIS